ncbi:uncharacterized protein At5g50100, chloroplastic isoform X2 [Macadamia integrifolia]|uniref:uncharacterized protein At5g50100, chloroplastic isoform X2 n=1 Tax=Macadamia integrifolia TaxID=60698 RepID=UPI001C4F7E3F|nr:uncharacterized protein At5g50100, chloroplastic isoform X2 [Macadamia integrifolia]
MAMRVAACVGRERIVSLSSLPRHFQVGTGKPVSVSAFAQHRVPYLRTRDEVKYQVRAIQEAAVDQKATDGESDKSSQSWKIKMLYDGDCPLCMREVNMLRERNKQYKAIKFVDIGSDEYSPEDNQGLDYKTAMGRIHAILSDGTVVTDVEAFRRLYEEVGLGWIYAITKYKPIAIMADAIYGVWAKYRLQITGRPSLEVILEERKKSMGETCNNSKTCKM